MSGQQFRCSDDARARGDRSVGTAPPARNWFLVEQDGCWGSTAWDGLRAGPQVKDQLEKRLEHAGARLMLIRRPGSKRDSASVGRRRWCLIQTDPHARQPARIVWGRADQDAGLLAAARLFIDGDEPVERIDPPTTDPDVPAILLVCTHGRKDVCCAVRGRPVAARAAALWPDSTWECTHTGGDRFAANVILLPDGACYGSLDPDDLEQVVGSHLRGEVDPTHLRGATGHTNRVQAAMVAAYERFRPLRFGDVRRVSETGTPEAWRVRLDVRDVGIVELTGHTQITEPEFLTCKAEAKKVMLLPVVDTVLLDRAVH
jgi:hypothetical protein